MTSSIHSLLSVERIGAVPGVRAFARRIDSLLESTEVLDRAWRGAVDEVGAAGQAMTSVFPDWEVIAVRWSAYVSEVREIAADAVRWFRASARDAVDHVNSLIVELDEWLGLTAAWSELRQWVLRELRSFRSGRTLRERLDHVEGQAGVTLAVIALATVGGLGLWGWWEWRKATAPQVALLRMGDGR